MQCPLSADAEGIKLRPEHMEHERLYHCIFKEKLMLVYKDNQDVLHCYEVVEEKLVDKARRGEEGIERILEEYIRQKRLND